MGGGISRSEFLCFCAEKADCTKGAIIIVEGGKLTMRDGYWKEKAKEQEEL